MEIFSLKIERTGNYFLDRNIPLNCGVLKAGLWKTLRYLDKVALCDTDLLWALYNKYTFLHNGFKLVLRIATKMTLAG